jgi:hypothetical protein
MHSRLLDGAQLDDPQPQSVIKEFETEFDSWAQMERDAFRGYVSSMTDSKLIRIAAMISTLVEYEGSTWPFCGRKVRVFEEEKTPSGFASPGYYFAVLDSAIKTRISKAAHAIAVSYLIAEVEILSVVDTCVVTQPWRESVGMRLFRSRVYDVIKGHNIHPGNHILFGYALMWKTDAGEGFPPEINPSKRYVVLLEARNYRSFPELDRRTPEPIEPYTVIPYIDSNRGKYSIQENVVTDEGQTFSVLKQMSVSQLKNVMRRTLRSFGSALARKE